MRQEHRPPAGSYETLSLEGMIDMFVYYLDLALRSLKRNRTLTALMVIAIAVGIGASMTTLTVMHLLSGDPLPGRSGAAVLSAGRSRSQSESRSSASTT